MNKKIRILATTDLHGVQTNLSKDAYSIDQANDILVDVGDYFIGNLVSTYYNTQKEVSPLCAIANDLGYEVMIAGNHDFDYGIDFLKKQVSYLKMDYLCANITDLQDNLIFKPYSIIEKNGIKIGFIGLVTSMLSVLSDYENTKDIKTLDVIETLDIYIKELRSQVDLLILLYHGGLERDLLTGKETQYNTGEDQAYKILETFSELDGLICGHQHRVNAGCVNNGILVQPGFKNSHLGVLTFEYENHHWNKEASLLPLSIHQEPLSKDLEAWLQSPIDISYFNEFMDKFDTPYRLIKIDGTSHQDFLNSFNIPYSLLKYELSYDEVLSILKDESIEGLRLVDGKVLPKQGSYSIITNTMLLPSYRLKQQYINNLFDEYCHYLQTIQ